jgi:hypothetical protein
VTYPNGFEGDATAGFFEYPAGVMTSQTTAIKAPGSVFYGRTATYDRIAGRWVPAPANAISPDGWKVAYAQYDLPPSPAPGMRAAANPGSAAAQPVRAGALASTGAIHIVDLRTGEDRIAFSGSPTYAVVGFTTDGVYLNAVQLTMDGAFANGLFLLNPSGGSPIPVADGDRTLDRFGWQVIGGAAWGADYSSGGGIQPGDRLLRLDVHTGTVVAWLTKGEGIGVSLIALDAQSHPIVDVEASGYSSTGSPAPTFPTQVWVLTAPGTGTKVYELTDPSQAYPSAPSFADANGVWISQAPVGNVWLYKATIGFKLVRVLSVSDLIAVAGDCE